VNNNPCNANPRRPPPPRISKAGVAPACSPFFCVFCYSAAMLVALFRPVCAWSLFCYSYTGSLRKKNNIRGDRPHSSKPRVAPPPAPPPLPSQQQRTHTCCVPVQEGGRGRLRSGHGLCEHRSLAASDRQFEPVRVAGHSGPAPHRLLPQCQLWVATSSLE